MNTPWILRPGARPNAHLRLFCFPYAGAGAALYVPWAYELDPSVEVCPVQLPGREGRIGERGHTRWPALLDEAVLALRPYLDVPFVFFGHSLGALIVFELARTLRERVGAQPLQLFVSGHRAPHLRSPHPDIAHLPDPEFVEAVIARYDGVPTEVLRHPDLMTLLLPGLRADMTLIEHYEYRDEPSLECPIVVFGGRKDAEATEAELIAWRVHTRGTFRVRRFPGAHFFIRDHRTAVVAAVSEELLRVDTPAREMLR